jgi:p21-activated kinase 1
MPSNQDKPPAPPLRLQSQAHQHFVPRTTPLPTVLTVASNEASKVNQVESKPLPKEPKSVTSDFHLIKKSSKSKMANKERKYFQVKPSANSAVPTLGHGHKLVISPPTNFEHNIHVGFDASSGEFSGLPDSWAHLLNMSSISKQEQKQHPQAVIDVLKWYDTSMKGDFGSFHASFANNSPKYMTMTEGKFAQKTQANRKFEINTFCPTLSMVMQTIHHRLVPN